MRVRLSRLPFAVAMLAAACATDPTDPVDPVPAGDTETVAPVAEDPWAGRVLPFDPSPDDRAFLGTGFTGYQAVPAETGYTQGVRVAGVQDGQCLANAGLQDGDVIVEFAGQMLDGPQPELIQQLREFLLPLPPDSPTSLLYWRKDAGVTAVELLLGRQPPRFDRLETSDSWFASPGSNRDLRALAASAMELDGGELRTIDTIGRHRERFAQRDVLRIRETVQVQLNLFAHESMAARVIEQLHADPANALALAAGAPDAPKRESDPPGDMDAELDTIEAFVVDLDRRTRDALGWSDAERAYVAAHLDGLTERTFIEGDYIYGDEDVERERANRDVMALLARVDRAALARIAAETTDFIETRAGNLRDLATAAGKNGLVAERDTPAGRIEIWSGGNQRHTQRCAFRFDLSGDDNYLDCAGRADLDQPVSITIDLDGDDVYGATSPFCQGAALGGVGVLLDRGGDDQYLARQWSQGAAVAGFGLLWDTQGHDTYRGNEVCQGVALAGGAMLHDRQGDDVYDAQRFSQGVGLPGGVGALLDDGGNDRYSSTGRYASEYGEPGVFSGWSQGVGFGFRRVASGGVGVLEDGAGDDVYEAGNFSQGGGYFFAWGVLRDASGNDRYIGSRYAQGFAAHQAAGTFIEGAGDDLYQSHAGVAQGLSWDETSVFFRDRGGNDRYQTRGFSLASAAHNGMVVFIDDGGDDQYADLPGKARSNNYHGGHSFALFVDRGGRDHYRGRNAEEWNDRVFWRHDGAYFLDLPLDHGSLREYVRGGGETE